MLLSFKPRFVNPIRAGFGMHDLEVGARFDPALGRIKRQTIRAERKDGKRPVPGEELHLYTGARTKQMLRIVPRQMAFCKSAHDIVLLFGRDKRFPVQGFEFAKAGFQTLDQFAIADGFRSWSEMCAFWKVVHDVAEFKGFITFWQAGRP